MFSSSRTTVYFMYKRYRTRITIVLVCGNYVEYGCTDYTDPDLYGEDGLPTFRPLVRTRTNFDIGQETLFKDKDKYRFKYMGKLLSKTKNTIQGQKQIQVQGHGPTLIKDKKHCSRIRTNSGLRTWANFDQGQKTLFKDKDKYRFKDMGKL